MHFFALLFIIIVAHHACGDLSVEPVAEPAEWPGWCDPRAYEIEGQWGREFTHRGHRFRTDIQIEATKPCEFDYAVQVRQADEGHAEERMHLSLGSLVVTDYEQSGPVGLLTIQARRTRQENRRPEGVIVADSTAQILPSQIAKLWGDGLVLWGDYYVRR